MRPPLIFYLVIGAWLFLTAMSLGLLYLQITSNVNQLIGVP